MCWRSVLTLLCYLLLLEPTVSFLSFNRKGSSFIFPGPLHAHIPEKDTTDELPTTTTCRRRAFVTGLTGWLAAATATTTASTALPAVAAGDIATGVFVRRTDQLAYQFQPPTEFGTVPNNKPLKTHLDEVNFISPNRKGYQFGITVDPVRIGSLEDFGTPEEVAAKVVLSEVNRDGVFDVTLMEDPLVVNGNNNKAYQLNYLSVGKRGRKRYVARFAIVKQKLYALTAQCLEEDYGDLQKALLKAVDSFQVLNSG